LVALIEIQITAVKIRNTARLGSSNDPLISGSQRAIVPSPLTSSHADSPATRKSKNASWYSDRPPVASSTRPMPEASSMTPTNSSTSSRHGRNRKTASANTATKNKPAPIGLPTLLSASTAKARPRSRGSHRETRGMPSTVTKNAAHDPSAISSMSERSRRNAPMVGDNRSEIQGNKSPLQDGGRRLHDDSPHGNGQFMPPHSARHRPLLIDGAARGRSNVTWIRPRRRSSSGAHGQREKRSSSWARAASANRRSGASWRSGSAGR